MSNEYDPDETGERISSFNRRNFVRALGGATVASGLFASPAQAVNADPLESADYDILSGDELAGLARDVVERTDVRNVVDSSKLETVRSASAVLVTFGEKPGVVFTDEPSTVDVERPIDDPAGDDIFVLAANHTLENGDTRTAIGFLTGDDEVVCYSRTTKDESEFTEHAIRFAVENRNRTVTVEDQSYNGEPPRPVSELRGEVTPNASDPCPDDDPCGGCHPGPPMQYGYYSRVVCNAGFDLTCLGTLVSTCGACAASCPASGPGCILCLYVACGAGSLMICCDGELEESCVQCGCAVCCSG